MVLNPDYIQTSIRIPRDLHAHLREVCFKTGRSLNQELLLRIEQHEEILERMYQLEERISKMGVRYG